MRIVFLGSGAFGIPTLDALSARHEVVAVVSQPDKPAGRGKVLTPTPLAVRAAELGIPLTTPIDINEPSVCAAVRAPPADAWVIIAFGQKLSRELIDGVFAVNLHGSLLPAYRGAAPIQRAVMDGCAQTGVSVISIAERMDAGLVYATRSRAIGASETSDDVHDALALLGPEVIDRHRAIVSLMEELEAVDWYDQRSKATDNAELRTILEHNRDEEKEHAGMALEWLRRNDPKLDQHLRTFLFTKGPITEVEASMHEGEDADPGASSDGSLGIGSLRQVKK